MFSWRIANPVTVVIKDISNARGRQGLIANPITAVVIYPVIRVPVISGVLPIVRTVLPIVWGVLPVIGTVLPIVWRVVPVIARLSKAGACKDGS